MKKTKLKRKSKSETRKVQDLLWQECRRIIKAKYIKDDRYYCFTCGKEIEGSNCQLGHFIPNSVGGASLRYNLDNLRLQCYYCNINLGGNGSEFYRKLVIEKGQPYVDALFELKNKGSINALDHYKKLLEEYKII
jgi:5-methylcytosine-specific restriction endonuclease McrA